jgi:hypothetical protein
MTPQEHNAGQTAPPPAPVHKGKKESDAMKSAIRLLTDAVANEGDKVSPAIKAATDAIQKAVIGLDHPTPDDEAADEPKAEEEAPRRRR